MEADLSVLCKGDDWGRLQARRLSRTEWAKGLESKENWQREKSILKENITTDKAFE